jgi:hypothetical protein
MIEIPKAWKNKVETGICRTCFRTFYRMMKKSRSGRGMPSGIRGFNCKTCSPKCARAFYKKRNEVKK